MPRFFALQSHVPNNGKNDPLFSIFFLLFMHFYGLFTNNAEVLKIRNNKVQLQGLSQEILLWCSKESERGKFAQNTFEVFYFTVAA